MADKRAKAIDGNTDVLETSGDGVPIEYTTTLDKAYCFFQDGHVQKIKYHPLPTVLDHVCVTTVVLPSMHEERPHIQCHCFSSQICTCCLSPLFLSSWTIWLL